MESLSLDFSIILENAKKEVTKIYFDSKYEAESFKSYLFTKIVRFLILQTVISQDVNRKNFAFVPHLEKYDQVFSDKILRKNWKISEDEWNYIDSKILETGK